MKKKVAVNKLAVAPIISTVLLLGLAVSLAISVYLWQVRQTEQISTGMVRFASGVLDCQEVNFNAYSSDGCTKVSIKNSGFFDVDGFVVRIFSSFGTGSEVKDVFVKAQGSDVLKIGLVNAEKIEVTPVIKVKGELLGCKDVTKGISCTGLDNIQVEACNTADAQGTCNLIGGSDIVTREECCKYLKKCC